MRRCMTFERNGVKQRLDQGYRRRVRNNIRRMITVWRGRKKSRRRRRCASTTRITSLSRRSHEKKEKTGEKTEYMRSKTRRNAKKQQPDKRAVKGDRNSRRTEKDSRDRPKSGLRRQGNHQQSTEYCSSKQTCDRAEGNRSRSRCIVDNQGAGCRNGKLAGPERFRGEGRWAAWQTKA